MNVLKSVKAITTSVVVAIFLFRPAVPVRAITYTMTTLPSAVLGVSGINPTGLISGQNSSYALACYDSVAGTTTLLGVPSYWYPRTVGINAAGQIIGIRYPDPNNVQVSNAFIWTSGSYVDIVKSNSTTTTRGGINSFGQVVGNFAPNIGPPNYAPFRYDSVSSTFVDLTANGNGMVDYDILYSINDAGEIVGNGNLASNPNRGFLWKQGVKYPITPTNGVQSLPNYINFEGTVVGRADNNIGWTASVPFVWVPTVPNGTSGKFKYLDCLYSGSPSGSAISVNNCGVVVGSSYIGPFFYSYHGFVWDPISGTQDLNNLVPGIGSVVITEADYINDLGQIVVSTSAGSRLLTPNN